MTLLARIRSFLFALLRRRRFEREMAQEWQFHLDARADLLEADGLSRAEAERQARAEFGDDVRWREQGREARGLRGIQDLQSDVRYALRQMRRAPAFAAIAVATLALAVGANTAIFSLVNSLLLRELPVREPDRLVTVSSADAVARGFPTGFNGVMWGAIREQAGAFDGAFAWSGVGPSGIRFNLAPRGETDLVDGLFVSGDFFTTLGVPALLGRALTAADDVRGGGPDGPVAVISYGLWQRRFGGAADVVGRPLTVDGVAFTIAGVTPPGFLGVEVGQAFDVALPLGTEPLLHGKDSWMRIQFLAVMLRLAPGQSLDAAQAALRAVQPRIVEAAAATSHGRVPKFLTEPLVLVPAAAGSSHLRQQYARPLVTLLAIATLVLLIACANIANLLLARATSRRHELSVRLALGAPRWRLARQLLVESLILAVAGAAAGVAFASSGSAALVSQISTWFNRVVLPAPLDWRVMAFTTIVTIATALIFGTAPAFYAARVPPIGALKEQASGARGLFAGRRLRLPGGLVIAQVALSLILVFAAGLFVRTFERLSTRPLGFERDRVLIVNVDAARALVDASQRTALYQTLADAVAAVPGVARAAASFNTPVNRGVTPLGLFAVPGSPPLSEQERGAVVNFVTPGWFDAYGTALRAGRAFDARDTRHAEPVIIVNEAFVRRFFPGAGRNPVGETIAAKLGGPPSAPPLQERIVGVVADAVDMTLRDDAPAAVFQPLEQWDVGMPPATISLSVRPSSAAPGAPMRLARDVAAALTRVDPRLAFTMRPLAEQVDAELGQERLLAMLSGFFGLVALLLAGLGLYGVTAYAVSGRRTEIGIRLALGARRGGVVRLVLWRAAALVCAGVAVGTLASVALSRLVATLLYGVEPRDPLTLISAAAMLATVGAVAAWVPAWRASRIDPAGVLRDQ